MQDEVSIAEAIRLFSSKTGTVNRLARWENVYRMWEAGKSLIDIGRWIGKSESTARQLLKRAALQRQKKPGFTWPLHDGQKVCDIPHPMPSKGEDPKRWHHARANLISPSSRQLYCPVCKKGFPLGKNPPYTFLGCNERITRKADGLSADPDRNDPEPTG